MQFVPRLVRYVCYLGINNSVKNCRGCSSVVFNFCLGKTCQACLYIRYYNKCNTTNSLACQTLAALTKLAKLTTLPVTLCSTSGPCAQWHEMILAICFIEALCKNKHVLATRWSGRKDTRTLKMSLCKGPLANCRQCILHLISEHMLAISHIFKQFSSFASIKGMRLIHNKLRHYADRLVGQELLAAQFHLIINCCSKEIIYIHIIYCPMSHT